MSKRFRASYKIAIGFAVLALLGIYGNRFANDFLLGRDRFAALLPGSVNIVGVDTSAGYRIVVQNSTAKLLMGEVGEFGPGEMSERALDSEGADKKYVPIKEMLEGMAGDGEALGHFVERLNEVKLEDYANSPVWKAEDIEKALSGDEALRERLVTNLGMKLDGNPLTTAVSRSAIYDGIVVDVPIPFQIPGPEGTATVVARVRQGYRPRSILGIENRTRSQAVTDHTIAAEYAQMAAAIRDGKEQREDIAASLRRIISESEKTTKAELPRRILGSVTVVVNEHQIIGASSLEEDGSRGKVYRLKIALNEEGKKRLWQFTRNRVGSQLLLTVSGVAIAAPTVQHGISSGEVEITRLDDESLVQDALDTMNQKRATN